MSRSPHSFAIIADCASKGHSEIWVFLNTTARKIGGTTLRSISDISRHQRLKDNNDEIVNPELMLTELCSDNLELTRFLRSAHDICEQYEDVATASLIENWIDETERRTSFLSEIVGAS